MTENPAYELKRLRALVAWYERDSEERMTYFMHEREMFEKRVFELTTERDRLARVAGGQAAAGALAIAVIELDGGGTEIGAYPSKEAWARVVELAKQVARDMIEAHRCRRVTTSSN